MNSQTNTTMNTVNRNTPPTNKQTNRRQDFFPPDFDDCRLAAGGGFAALFCFTRRSSSRAELFLDWGRGLMSSKKKECKMVQYSNENIEC